MAFVTFPDKPTFRPLTITIETKEELEELVRELGEGSGRRLNEVYDALFRYLDTLNA